MASTSGSQRRKVCLGDWVIVKVNDGAKYIVVEVKEEGTVKALKKKTFACKLLIGQFYGDHLELDKKGNLNPWDRSQEVKVIMISN